MYAFLVRQPYSRLAKNGTENSSEWWTVLTVYVHAYRYSRFAWQHEGLAAVGLFLNEYESAIGPLYAESKGSLDWLKKVEGARSNLQL